MDNLRHELDKEAYNSIRCLQVWLSTVAPVEPVIAKDTKDLLLKISTSMNWPMDFQEELGCSILKPLQAPPQWDD